MFIQGSDPLRFQNVRHQELLEEARQYQLLRQTLGKPALKDRALSNSLAKLGHLLAGWGTSLERRYGAPSGDCEAETA